MTVNREISEGIMVQGKDEQIVYTLTTTNWGSDPSSPVVAVFSVDGTTLTDVTSTVMPTNSPTVSNDIITLSVLKSLTAGTKYRVEVKFTSAANIFEAFAIIEGED